MNGVIIPTAGFTTTGVSAKTNINNKLIKTNALHCLKTASGFGGCNASIVFSKS